MRGIACAVSLLIATTGLARPMVDTTGLAGAEIVLLGEAHDNPGHHERQAEAVGVLQPAAIVFEMLTSEQAARVTDGLRGDRQALADALGWEVSGWPDFAMYHPIFTAAPAAGVYGASLPREAARVALADGIANAFGAEAAAYGLTDPLPAEAQAAREAEQADAHCGALPEAMLPGMVDLQRLRDAMLARAALKALDATGGPVVVITGNGHARRDGGVPEVLARVRPDTRVIAVGQDEAGRIEGRFDILWPGDPVDRGDPCAAFRKN